MNHFKKGITAVLLVLILSTIALAELAQTHYTTLRDTVPKVPTVQSAISSAQSAVFSTTTPIDPSQTLGNPNLTADVAFSNTSATAALTLGLYFKTGDGVYTFLGTVKSVTVTASSTVNDSAGKFHCVTMPTFDTLGASHYDLRVTAISGGSVSVRPWTYGAKSIGHD